MGEIDKNKLISHDDELLDNLLEDLTGQDQELIQKIIEKKLKK